MKTTGGSGWKEKAVGLIIGTAGVLAWVFVFVVLPQILFGIRM